MMAQHLRSLLALTLILVIPSLEASALFWSPRPHRSSSIINISVGNRVNTSAGMDDHGTSIRDLAINLSRWNGNLTFVKNGTQIFVTRGNNGVTNIRITFDPQSTATNSTGTNSTQSTSRRRKRAIGNIPYVPTTPIPVLNGSQAFLNWNTIPLPDAIISNLTGNDTRNFVQPWQFLQTFLDRRLPMLLLDSAVSFLSQLYSSTGKRMLQTGISDLGEFADFASGVVNSTMDLAQEQASNGMQNVVRTFKGLTPVAQKCVGQVPDDAAEPIVSKAFGCVRDRWNEVEELVNQFLVLIHDTEDAYGGWLQALDGCTARNFAGESESEVDTAQRKCYVEVITESVGKMVEIPMRWGDLTARTSNAVMGFQPRVGGCIAGVGGQVAGVSARIGVRIMLCQMFQ